jgi:hypothetical protein
MHNISKIRRNGYQRIDYRNTTFLSAEPSKLNGIRMRLVEKLGFFRPCVVRSSTAFLAEGMIGMAR